MQFDSNTVSETTQAEVHTTNEKSQENTQPTLPNDNPNPPPSNDAQPLASNTASILQNFPATRQTSGYSPLTPPFLSQGYPYVQSSYVQNYQATFPQPVVQTSYAYPSYPNYSTTNSSTQHNYNYYPGYPGVNYVNYNPGYGSVPSSYHSVDKSDLKEALGLPESPVKSTDTDHLIQKRDRDRRQEKDWNPNLMKKRKQERKKREPVETEVPDDFEIEVVWSDSSLIKNEEGNESTEKRYDSVIANGKTYKVGDTIAVWPEGGSKKPAPMGTIKSLYTDGENNNMQICWFYRLEETAKTKKKPKVAPREVFLSSHTDENPVESIAKEVTVKPIWEIVDVEEYITQPDCYYYKKKYDHLERTFIDL